MDKRCIHIRECKVGDMLAENVAYKYGAVIATAHTVVNRYIKSKLVAMGIKNVWIYDCREQESGKDENSRYRAFKENYKKNIMVVKDIFCDSAAGKGPDPQRLRQVAASIYGDISQGGRMVKYLSQMGDADEYLYHHSINVAFYAMLIGKWTGCTEGEIRDIIQAGVLHDIGKTRVRADLLNKKEKLFQKEFEEIKKHAVYGYEIIKSVEGLSEKIKQAVLMHHERETGSGYPLGLKAAEINMYARIIAIADVYDAMTSDRIYKKQSTPFEVFEMFGTTGKNNFDAWILQVFLSNLTSCYIGSKVRLNTGENGEIVYIPPCNITKPVIYIKPDYVDISQKDGLEIVSIK